MTTTYAVVAAVRIQDWLTRTVDLRLMRGASKALSDQTSGATNRPRLAGFSAVGLEPAAGDIDGVVAISGDNAEQVAQAQLAIGQALQQALPGLQWTTWRTTAPDYLAAYRKQEQGSPDVARRALLPVQLDFPAARMCSGCGIEPASGITPHDDTDDDGLPTRYGPDCSVRWHAGPGQRGVDGKATTFEQLARHGGSPTPEIPGRVRNHLATICVDGNRVGEVLSRAAASSSAAADALARRIERHVGGALAAANDRVRGTDDGAITHFHGGDDVFVSVPARLAWVWVRTFARELERLEGDTDASPETSVPALTVGIGMTIAHARHPIHDTHDLAEQALAQAKRLTGGRTTAVTWRDLTAETVLPTGRVLPYAELVALQNPRTGAAEVLVMTPSGRDTLARVISSDAGDDVLRQWALRGGYTELAGAMTGEWRAGVADLLCLARWWPEARHTEDDPTTGGTL